MSELTLTMEELKIISELGINVSDRYLVVNEVKRLDKTMCDFIDAINTQLVHIELLCKVLRAHRSEYIPDAKFKEIKEWAKQDE